MCDGQRGLAACCILGPESTLQLLGKSFWCVYSGCSAVMLDPEHSPVWTGSTQCVQDHEKSSNLFTWHLCTLRYNPNK